MLLLNRYYFNGEYQSYIHKSQQQNIPIYTDNSSTCLNWYNYYVLPALLPRSL